MRVTFATNIIEQYKTNKNLVFLTGDLGFMALEEVKKTMGERFINAGVAEQNLISVAAALAHEGLIPIAYSISPFITLRPYEQIRNDVCLHQLPVKIVGNGGGFGYGIMGSTHHNIEDIGAMCMLPYMQVFVPYHDADISVVLEQMFINPNPNYLRLNIGATHKIDTPFQQWRQIKKGNGLVIIGVGPIVENVLALPQEIVDELEIWVVGILPVIEIPHTLKTAINTIKKVFVIEEHQQQGGLNETIAALILKNKLLITHFDNASADNILDRYGSQKWYQEQLGMRGVLLQNKIENILKK